MLFFVQDFCWVAEIALLFVWFCYLNLGGLVGFVVGCLLFGFGVFGVGVMVVLGFVGGFGLFVFWVGLWWMLTVGL